MLESILQINIERGLNIQFIWKEVQNMTASYLIFWSQNNGSAIEIWHFDCHWNGQVSNSHSLVVLKWADC